MMHRLSSLAVFICTLCAHVTSFARLTPTLAFSTSRALARRAAPASSSLVRSAASSSSSRGEGDDVLLQLLQRKKYEIEQLERLHSSSLDPLQLRLGYVSDTSSLKLTRALRLFTLGDDRRVAVVGDMKRMSPTAPNLPRVVSTFVDAGRRTDELFGWGVNACLANTDGPGWGGAHEDLEAAVAAQKRRRAAQHAAEEAAAAAAASGAAPTVVAEWAAHTAVVCKDLLIHPLQVAAAVERGADGVLLTAALLGGRLEEMIDACTVMGTEALVEVHTPNECAHALECGAMLLMVNNWDRADGQWHPNQAEAVRRMIPDNVVTVAAGGIGSSEQARTLSNCGFDAVCLGRALSLHPDPPALIKNVRNFQGPPLMPGTNGGLVNGLF